MLMFFVRRFLAAFRRDPQLPEAATENNRESEEACEMPRATRSTSSYGTRHHPYNLRSRTSAAAPAYENVVVEDPEAEIKPPQILSVDLKKALNSERHHTTPYEVQETIVRRGQPVELALKFDNKVDFEHFDVTLVLLTGRSPAQSKGTLTRLLLSGGTAPAAASARKKWCLEEVKDGGDTLHVTFTPPPTAHVGHYSVALEVLGKKSTAEYRLKREETFYVIFNPWCKDDLCYMEDETCRQEYVMNDSGRIWVGSAERHGGKPWVFGQFEKVSFDAALHVLQISQIADTAMGNPLIITRVLSKMVNSNDDDGILEGNWSGEYGGGTNPSDWISSTAILEEYMKTQRGVKYGQCWVFSGVFTTLMRALGIPSRSVTNFESAHDSDFSMTIDRYWDEDGKPMSEYNDSIWNFHVWNEGYYKREDIPDGYDGWQAVDATPQEPSEGVMQCGPAPVKALKTGAVFLPHDSKFIFAEVNGDIVEWTVLKNGELRPEYKDTRSVGKFISTKAVGSNRRDDLTLDYKFKEGSEEERKAMVSAAKLSSKSEELMDFYDIPDTEKVLFTFTTEGKKSGDWRMVLVIKNTTGSEAEVTVTMTANGVSYTGTVARELLEKKMEVKVPKHASTEVEVTMAAKDYLNKLRRDATVNAYCRAKVAQSGQVFFKKENFFIDRPDVTLSTSSTVVKVDEAFELDVSFKNELSVDLTGCSFTVQGPGIAGSKTLKVKRGTIESGGSFKGSMSLTPRLAGNREIVAQLNCNQLQNVTGVTSVTVR